VLQVKSPLDVAPGTLVMASRLVHGVPQPAELGIVAAHPGRLVLSVWFWRMGDPEVRVNVLGFGIGEFHLVNLGLADMPSGDLFDVVRGARMLAHLRPLSVAAEGEFLGRRFW
jgi:hypothetical protein